MTQPIVIAYHLIWTGYGWWLPNDPRGSRSTEIRNDVLAELGDLHFGRKGVQPAGKEVRQFYDQAGPLLQHALLSFDDAAREEIALAFGQVIEEQRYTCYACAIMPDHVHILIRKHKHQAEDMIQIFKDSSRLRLSATQRYSAIHLIWTRGGGWKVFLDHPDEVRRTIANIEPNPKGAGLPPQHWPFLKIYDGWPLHPGHSPHSPYVRRLREAGRYPS